MLASHSGAATPVATEGADTASTKRRLFRNEDETRQEEDVGSQQHERVGTACSARSQPSHSDADSDGDDPSLGAYWRKRGWVTCYLFVIISTLLGAFSSCLRAHVFVSLV